MKIIRIIVCLLCFASFAFAGNRDEKPFRAKVDDDGVQRITVVGGEYYFQPSHIIVKINTPVELTVMKTSTIVPHDIVMDAPEAGMDFKLGLDRTGSTVTFIPKKTGKYPFYCSKKFLFFKSHRDKGMEGVFEVVK